MIYLFDKNEELIKLLRRSAVKSALQTYTLTNERYVSDRLTVEVKALSNDELERVEYMAIQSMDDSHAFHYFYVAQKVSEDKLTTLIGVQSGIEELRKTLVYDKRPTNAYAKPVIADLLSDSNWTVRFVGDNQPHSTNFYYLSVFDALKKVCEVWQLEMQFFVEMNGNRIGARYIDFKQRIGQAVGKRVVYGHNALQILQEVERTNIYTALVGRGKGVQISQADGENQQAAGYSRKITFADVVWSRANGDPVDKPKGQVYLELPQMTQLYGIRNTDGSLRPKVGLVEFSEEDQPDSLIRRTYERLVDLARPQLTLKTTSVYLSGAGVGDTVRVVRHDKHLDYDTRIFEIVVNRLNNRSSDIKLGDNLKGSSGDKIQAVADKAVDDFVTNEFSNFVSHISDFLPSADGFNRNWYLAEDPTVKYPGKVVINDIWYKPDPEHEGHTIILRWTGEVWEELIRTYASQSLKERIDQEFASLNQSLAEQERDQAAKVAEILAKANVNASLASQAKVASDQAKSQAAQALADALRAKSEAIAEAERLSRETEASLSLEINQTKESLTSLAKKTEVDQLKQTVTNQATTISQQADSLRLKAESWQVSQLNDRVAGNTAELGVLNTAISQKVSRTDFDRATGRLSSAESSLETLAGEIRTKLTRTEVDNLVKAKGYATSSTVQNLVRETADSYERKLTETRGMIPKELGAVNLVRNSKINQSSNAYGFADRTVRLEVGKTYWLTARAKKTGGTAEKKTRVYLYKSDWSEETNLEFSKTSYETKCTAFTARAGGDYLLTSYWFPNGGDRSGTADVDWYMVTEGDMPSLTWSPAPEDLVTETAFHEVRDTVASHTRTIADQGQSISQVVQTASGLVSRVQGLENDVVREADVAITPGRIQLTARKSIDTQTVANMFSVDDKMISAVANRFVITGQNYNLVDKDKQVSFSPPGQRDMVISPWYTDRLEAGEEFVASYHLTRISTGATIQAQALLHLQFTDGSQDWLHPLSSQVGDREDVLRVPTTGKTVSRYRFFFQQNGWSSFSAYWVTGLTIRRKTSASLLVDGSITSRHLASGSVETGHLTAGSITGGHIQADAVSGRHIVADEALFNKLTANEALLDKLFAKEVFSTRVKAEDVSASRITTGVIRGLDGSMNIDLGFAGDRNTPRREPSISFNSDTAALRRHSNNSSQFIKMLDGGLVTIGGKGIKASRTIIGSNYNRTESLEKGFAGLEIYNGQSNNLTRLVGNRIELTSRNQVGNWIFDAQNKGDMYLYPGKTEGLTTHLGHPESRISMVYANDMSLSAQKHKNNHSFSVKTSLKNLWDLMDLIRRYAGDLSHPDVQRAMKQTIDVQNFDL